MKLLKLLMLLPMMCGFIISHAQHYEVAISPVSVDGLGGLQSYAVGTFDGEWLLVGGRLDGLHQRQPFAAFSADGRNQDLIVVNPKSQEVWRTPLSTLPTSIQEQLSSTNMQFYQDNNKLLCTGGYGYSPSFGDHITFPYLTVIDIPQTISDVKNNTLKSSTFFQIENEVFRATGGGLNKIEDIYYLVGGQKFMGRYNPMGPEFGPGFEQEYTNEVRKFSVDTLSGISVEILNPIHDEMHLHRRDYNLVPYLSNGERELMVYSGVFRNTVDLPWLYPVKITKNDYIPREDFTQYFNHYHCGYLSIYNPEEKEMSTMFFGGIAQFYVEDDILVQDNDVPFVNTITEVSINKLGEMKETRLTETLPGYLGAGSVFILDPNIELADDDILDGSTIGNEYQDVGYLYGGIRSSLPNIFWINTGQESEANNTIYKISIRKVNDITSVKSIEKSDHLQFYPNPTNQLVRMSIQIEKPTELSISITDPMGKQIHMEVIKKEETVQGKNILVLDNVKIGYGAFYYTVKVDSKVLTRKVIWTE